MVLQRSVNWLLGRSAPKDETPTCPDHGEPMLLYKKVGKPARFSDQDVAEYDLLYRCPVPACDRTEVRHKVRTQIPVPGESTPRPRWAARRDTSI